MPLPPLTPEQRSAALEKAALARKQRAEIKEQLKHSGTSLSSVLDQGEADEVVGKPSERRRTWQQCHIGALRQGVQRLAQPGRRRLRQQRPAHAG